MNALAQNVFLQAGFSGNLYLSYALTNSKGCNSFHCQRIQFRVKINFTAYDVNRGTSLTNYLSVSLT